jgi:hypothetical protein
MLSGTNSAVVLWTNCFGLSNAGQRNVLVHELLHAYSRWDDDKLLDASKRYGLVKTGFGSSDISDWLGTDCQGEAKIKWEFEGPSFITPRQGFHWPFELWIHLFRTLSPPTEAYAEVWKLGSGAGLALRNSSGRIDHMVITGSNPFEMRWKDLDLKILYLAVHQPGRGVKGRGPSPAVRVFVESPRTLSSIEAVGVTKEVKAKIGLQNIEVVLADNPWFTDDVYYPVYNRLAAYPSTLPGEQYLKSIKWFCETDCLKMLPTR